MEGRVKEVLQGMKNIEAYLKDGYEVEDFEESLRAKDTLAIGKGQATIRFAKLEITLIKIEPTKMPVVSEPGPSIQK